MNRWLNIIGSFLFAFLVVGAPICHHTNAARLMEHAEIDLVFDRKYRLSYGGAK